MEASKPENAPKRVKDPVAVRRRILEAAETLASTGGAEAVRMAEVAKLAGVTTGGIVHHFPNKDALLRAVLMTSIEVLERDVKEGASKRDGGEKGSEEGSSASEYPALHITSIYLRHALSSSNEQFKSLIRLTLSSLELSELWNERLRKLLQNAHPSDRTTEAYLLRCAADGLWLSMLTSSATDMPEHAEACRILQSQLDILRERLEDPE